MIPPTCMGDSFSSLPPWRAAARQGTRRQRQEVGGRLEEAVGLTQRLPEVLWGDVVRAGGVGGQAYRRWKTEVGRRNGRSPLHRPYGLAGLAPPRAIPPIPPGGGYL